tara:strand:+ start:146 stop:655 length:510 start_codon:yes stop_codon:yes gene_type:complete
MSFRDALLGRKSSTSDAPNGSVAVSSKKHISDEARHLRRRRSGGRGSLPFVEVCVEPLLLETELEKLHSFFLKSGMRATIKKEKDILRSLDEVIKQREQTYLAIKDVVERSEQMAKEEAEIYYGEERCQYDTSTLAKHCVDILKFAAFVESDRALSELSEVIDVDHWDR